MPPVRRFKVIPLLLALTSCTWVKLDEGADGVALISTSAAATCEKIGTTVSQSKAAIGIIERNDEKVASEVLALARNSALDMGGDSIAESGDLKEGKQAFSVYRCQAQK